MGNSSSEKKRTDGSVEQHVYEILKDLKSEMVGVHQRIQRVEAHLEDVFKLYAASTITASSSSVVTPTSSPVWLGPRREQPLKSSSSRSNQQSQQQQPKIEDRLTTDRPRATSPIEMADFGVPPFDLIRETTSSCVDENCPEIPKPRMDRRPPELLPRRSSVRISRTNKTKSSVERVLPRKRTPLLSPSSDSRLKPPDNSEKVATNFPLTTDANEPLIRKEPPEIRYIDTEEDPLIRVSIPMTEQTEFRSYEDLSLRRLVSSQSLTLQSSSMQDNVFLLITQGSSERENNATAENESSIS